MTTNSILAVLSIIGGICSIVFGYAAFSRNRKREDTGAGKVSGQIMTELGYIKGGIDDVKTEQREQRRTNTDFVSRIVAVESSAKQAHRRIDKLEEKEKEKE